MSNPGYYAIIPANVRYDDRLVPNAKLIYAEITCLCNKNGVCTASNRYFANLYKSTTVSVSNWISKLNEYGYIDVDMIYKEGSKEIKNRNIRINNVSSEKIESLNREDTTETSAVTDDIDFNSLLTWFNKLTGKNIRVINDKARKQFRARLKEGYTKKDILEAVKNCFNDDYHKANPKFLTPEFISRPDKFEKYLNSKTTVSNENKRKELLKSMGI